MPLAQVGNSNYTAITTAGTTTLNQGQPGQTNVPIGVIGGNPIGQSGNLPAAQGAFYGFDQIAPGTSFAATVLDVVPPTLAQYNAAPATLLYTSTLLSGTGTAGQSFQAGVPGVGIRYKGALVVVTTGTPGQINALWD